MCRISRQKLFQKYFSRAIHTFLYCDHRRKREMERRHEERSRLFQYRRTTVLFFHSLALAKFLFTALSARTNRQTLYPQTAKFTFTQTVPYEHALLWLVHTRARRRNRAELSVGGESKVVPQKACSQVFGAGCRSRGISVTWPRGTSISFTWRQSHAISYPPRTAPEPLFFILSSPRLYTFPASNSTVFHLLFVLVSYVAKEVNETGRQIDLEVQYKYDNKHQYFILFLSYHIFYGITYNNGNYIFYYI